MINSEMQSGVLLNKLQCELEAIYAIELQHRVHDFVIDDPHLVSLIDNSPNAREIPEKLLIHQDGENVDIALYLDSQLIKRLEENDPTEQLHNDNIHDFWVALEGISHFLYFSWNVTYERQVSLLELELQAEVDKFILAALLLEKQFDGRIPQGLHYHLFHNAGFDSRLNEVELTRYRDANYYAGKFCLHLNDRFLKRRAHSQLVGEQLMNELRRFYRFNQPRKLRAIGCL
jgi:hypothetical protein